MSVRRRRSGAPLRAGLVSLCLLLALVAGGCGQGSKSSRDTQASAGKRAAVVTPVPVAAYRVGQFCTPSSRARYRRFGLTCHRSHLVAR